MLLITIIFIICTIWCSSAFYLHWREQKKDRSYYDYTASKVVSIVVFIILCLVIISVSVGTNYTVIQTKNGIVTMQKQKAIYQERKKILMIQYTNMLDSNYGHYEKGIFNQIAIKQSNGNPNVAVNVYPEIKYSATLIDLSNRLQQLTDDIYTYDIKIENEKLWITNIKSSPFLLQMFISGF
jgi:hypothetical protein